MVDIATRQSVVRHVKIQGTSEESNLAVGKCTESFYHQRILHVFTTQHTQIAFREECHFSIAEIHAQRRRLDKHTLRVGCVNNHIMVMVMTGKNVFIPNQIVIFGVSRTVKVDKAIATGVVTLSCMSTS